MSHPTDHASATADTPLLTPSSNRSASTVNGNGKRKKERTPLPKVQLTIALLLQICEPITSSSLYPYINQLVSELDITGGDERKTGYYAGIIESVFFMTEAVTVFHWSRLSDRIGRKPVLLIGVSGTMISMLWFGLSKTFWMLVASRSLVGLLNGNIGVMKSMMGDLTDASNRAEGFALIPVAWSVGATLGPLLGGSLAKPHDRFPCLFTARFWQEYPYFLPCLAAAACVFVGFVLVLLFLKETNTKIKNKDQEILFISEPIDTSLTNHHSSSPSLTQGSSPGQSLPFRSLLTYPVLLSIINYVLLAFLNIAINALFPLFLSMPISIGGLGLPPSTIGYIIGSYGFFTGLFQFFFFAKLVRGLGERRVFLNGMCAFVPIFAIMPLANWVAWKHANGEDVGGAQLPVIIWVLIGVFVILEVVMDVAYGAIFIFIISSAPSPSSLGATNGLSQTLVSFARAVGPALATALFSLSVERNYLGGYAVYLFWGLISLGSLSVAMMLPVRVWDDLDVDGEGE